MIVPSLCFIVNIIVILIMCSSDPRFPMDGAVQLHFAGLERRGPPPAPTPAVPVDSSADHVTSWDSYQHLDLTPPLSPDSDDEQPGNDIFINITILYIYLFIIELTLAQLIENCFPFRLQMHSVFGNVLLNIFSS